MERYRFFSSVIAAVWVWIGPGFAEAGASETLAGNIVSVSGKVMIRQEHAGASKDLRPALPGKGVFVGDIITTPSDGRIKLLLKDRSIMDVGPSSLFKMDQVKLGAGGQREVDATMPYGSLRAGVTRKLEGKSHFKVRTASATMGVRGTEFVVKSEIGDLKRINQVLSAPPGELPKMDFGAAAAPRTEVTVLQGRVEVGTPQAPQASPGATAAAGAAGSTGGSVLTPGMQLVAGAGINTGGNEGRGPASGGTEVRKLDTQKLSEVATTSRVQDKTFEQASTIQGTTREEEAQAKREERREERREDRQEERREARAEDKRSDEKREETRGESRQAQATQEGESRQAQSTQEGASSSGRTPASSSSSATTGIALLTTAVTTNVQVALPVIQTIRVADVIPNTVTSTQAVTQDQPALPTVHTLTIQIQTPNR